MLCRLALWRRRFIPKSAAAAELKDAIEMVMQGKTYVSAQTPQQTAARVSINDDKTA
jgi:DNA-binding NarL/FixJ family response regulator